MTPQDPNGPAIRLAQPSCPGRLAAAWLGVSSRKGCQQPRTPYRQALVRHASLEDVHADGRRVWPWRRIRPAGAATSAARRVAGGSGGEHQRLDRQQPAAAGDQGRGQHGGGDQGGGTRTPRIDLHAQPSPKVYLSYRYNEETSTIEMPADRRVVRIMDEAPRTWVGRLPLTVMAAPAAQEETAARGPG